MRSQKNSERAIAIKTITRGLGIIFDRLDRFEEQLAAISEAAKRRSAPSHQWENHPEKDESPFEVVLPSRKLGPNRTLIVPRSLSDLKCKALDPRSKALAVRVVTRLLVSQTDTKSLAIEMDKSQSAIRESMRGFLKTLPFLERIGGNHAVFRVQTDCVEIAQEWLRKAEGEHDSLTVKQSQKALEAGASVRFRGPLPLSEDSFKKHSQKVRDVLVSVGGECTVSKLCLRTGVKIKMVQAIANRLAGDGILTIQLASAQGQSSVLKLVRQNGAKPRVEALHAQKSIQELIEESDDLEHEIQQNVH